MERAPDIYFYSTLVAHFLELCWSVAAVAVGAVYFVDCPDERRIPAALLGLSAAMLIDAALFLVRNRVHRDLSYRAVQVHNVATAVATLLLLTFLVTTLVFFAKTDFSDDGSKVCDLALYNFALGTAIFALIVLLLFKRNPFPCIVFKGNLKEEEVVESKAGSDSRSNA